MYIILFFLLFARTAHGFLLSLLNTYKIDCATLYTNSGVVSDAINSTQTFTDNPTNYTFLKIYAQEAGQRKIYSEIYNPTIGDKINIVSFVSGNNGTADGWSRNNVYEITSTGLKCVSGGMTSFSASGTVSTTVAGQTVIKRVDGVV